MNTKGRILLFGNYDGSNIGDDCILLHILNKFAKYANRMYVPSRNSAYIAQKYNVNSIPLHSFRFISEFLRCNIFLIGGGGIFSKYIGPYAKLLPMFAILAKFFGKKVIYYNVGVYSTTPFLVKELVKLSMLCSDKITVRDKASFDAIGYIKAIKKVKIVPDPGLTFKPIDKSKAKRILQNEGIIKDKFLVGLSLKYTMNKEINSKIVSEFSRFIDWVIERFDAEVVFFPFSFNQRRIVENDVHIAKKIHRTLSENKVNFKIIRTWNYTPYEIKGLVGLMNVFIGMRFHSIIFAYSMGTPLIGVSYEDKCEDFLKSRQLPFIEVKDVGFDVMKQFFLSVIKDGKNEDRI